MNEIDELIEARIDYTFKRYQAQSDDDSFGTDCSMVEEGEGEDVLLTSFDKIAA